MNPDDTNKIDSLSKSLYSRTAPEIKSKRRLRFREQGVDVGTDWKHEAETPMDDVELNKKYKNSTMSFLTKILVTSIIFFIVALGIGSYLVFNGSNIVSANNVDITINGPVSVAGGEPVSFEVQVSNRNNIKLETVDLAVDYPSGTTDAEDSLKELKSTRELIPDINPGGVGQKTIKAIVYGEENSKKQIKVTIEYRVKGSSAVFQKEKTFDLLISSAPLSLSISSFKEVNSSQEFELAVTLNSNSKEVIKNLVLKAVYPFGFTYISSDSQPGSDSTTWKIGDIPPGGKRVVKIKGKLEGQDDESRVFRFTAGAARLGNDKVIGTEYISGSQEVSIKKAFMTVGISLDGDSNNEDAVSSFNNPVRVDVSYFNNLQTAVLGAEIRVKISGSAYDKNSVRSDDGLFNSLNDEVVWNSINTPDLNTIEAGGSGKVSFSVTPRDLSNLKKFISNPNLKFVVSVKAKRNSETNVPENLVATAARQTKISSNISLGGQIQRSIGAFANTGPIPPKANQQTTYTVVWTIDNTANSASNVQVESSLPSYVKWVGKTEPSTEDISYDVSDGKVIWNAGGVSTYTAGTNKRKQVSFQIALTPSLTQVGSIPTLINQTTLTAQDDFTGETLKSNLGTLNTRFSTDSAFKDGDEKVAQ